MLSQAERVILWMVGVLVVAGVWATYFTVNPTNPENMVGGGDAVCITATPNPTQSTVWTQTPSATLTPSPTLTSTPMLILPSPTKVTVTLTQTAVSARCNQPNAEHAISAEGYYRVTGLWQNVRSSPTTALNNIVGSLQRDTVVEVFWTARDNRGVLWVGVNRECSRWASSTLGIYPYIP